MPSAAWPPDYAAVWRDRHRRLDALREDLEFRQLLRVKYAADPVLFIEHWMVTYDPRESSTPVMPFVMFDRQRELVRWLLARFEARDDGMIEKARDTGVTWICVAFSLWLWTYRPGVKVGFGSRKELLVDRIGDADSIFEKARVILRHLPVEILPPGFDVSRDAGYLKIINPDNGSALTGEAGDQIGRGGRSSMYFKDESAFYERPKLIEASLSQNSDCKIDVTTVNPGAVGGPAHRKRTRWVGTERLFEFDWRQDPRKDDAWYEDQKSRHEADVIASEIDRNWEARVENVTCPAAWVRAARELTLRASGPRLAGLDVGGGSDLSVFVVRQGPVVETPVAWSDPDVINTAQFAAEQCRLQHADLLNYDVFGIGGGVMAALKRIPGVRAQGINVGQPASDRLWPDNKRSREKFLNLKAELWWLMRDALQRTFEHVTWLESGGQRGRQHPPQDLVSLPEDDVLAGQLSSVRWHRTPAGKIQIETKEELVKRGVKSPDHADALALTFAPGAQEIKVRTVRGMY